MQYEINVYKTKSEHFEHIFEVNKNLVNLAVNKFVFILSRRFYKLKT